MGRIKHKLLELERMTDQLIIERTLRIDRHKYIEYVWITEDNVIFPDPTEMGGWSEPLAAFIIEGIDDNARYIVRARNPQFSYVQCYTGQTVCECKEFIEAYINEPQTQEIMKLSSPKEQINYKGAGTHWRTANPMDD